MTLPVRLEAGDPAPETGVLVPLYGPAGATEGISWWGVERYLVTANAPFTADHIQAIADAAAAPRPLRVGDRVQVGNTTATVCSTTDGGVRVNWDASYPFLKTWLPIEAVTRIEGDGQ